MTRHFGVSSAYDYNRRHFQTPRTQREAGIDHLEWEQVEHQFTMVWWFIAAMGVAILIGALIAVLT